MKKQSHTLLTKPEKAQKGLLWQVQILMCLLAHQSQRLLGELIGYQWSGVRRRPSSSSSSSIRPLFSNVFSSETARPIKAKIFVEPPWEGGTKVYINSPGHMTKMAAMSIYGKNLKKSSSPEPEVL